MKMMFVAVAVFMLSGCAKKAEEVPQDGTPVLDTVQVSAPADSTVVVPVTEGVAAK